MRQLHLESLKAKSQSYIYASISEAIHSGDEIEVASKDSLKTFRSSWNKRLSEEYGESMTVGTYIDSYPDRI